VDHRRPSRRRRRHAHLAHRFARIDK
jgi:hypothetical protein